MLTGNYTGYNRGNSTFTSRLPKGVFYDPKDIPRLRCAKCRCKMLSKAEETAIAYDSVPVDNVNILENIPEEIKARSPVGMDFAEDFLDKLGLKSLKKFYMENKNSKHIGDFSRKESKQIKDVVGQIFTMSGNTEKTMLPTKKIMRNVKKIKSELPKETEELVDIIDGYTQKYPNRSLQKIILDEDLYEYHMGHVAIQQRQYNTKYKRHVSQMDKIVQTLTSEQQSDFEALKPTLSSISRNKSLSDDLKKELFKEETAEFLQGISDEGVRTKLGKQILSLPLEHASGDYLFCKLHRIPDVDDDRIVKFLVYPSKNTFEHVDAKSLGGPNDPTNGIYLCSHCNHERGTIPYPIMMRAFPDFGKNIQQQVSRLTTFIKKGALIGYERYPQGIKKRVFDACGEDINIDRFLRDERQVVRSRITDKKKAAEKKEKTQTSLMKQIKKLQAQLKGCRSELKEINTSIKEDRSLLRKLDEDLADKQ